MSQDSHKLTVSYGETPLYIHGLGDQPFEFSHIQAARMDVRKKAQEVYEYIDGASCYIGITDRLTAYLDEAEADMPALAMTPEFAEARMIVLLMIADEIARTTM